MAFRDMYSEISSIPKIPREYAKTLVNRALQKIYDESSWSFQLGEAGWLTPDIVATANNPSDGTVTFTIGSDQVLGDATAQAAWNALTLPPITFYQIRSPAYALYSVISYDPGTGFLTLDRPWMEPVTVSGAGQTYEMYQAYYPAPVADFKRFLTVRDFTNGANLDFWSYKQSDLAINDPQRTIFQNPAFVVPFEVDSRGAGTPNASATLGYMLFELWPQQLAQLPYALYFLRNGPLLSSPGDTVPYPLNEDVVLCKARVLAYEWVEGQKDQSAARGSGGDYRFLMQAAQLQYQDRIMDVRKKDRDLCDNFITKLRLRGGTIGGPFYSAVTRQASVGSW